MQKLDFLKTILSAKDISKLLPKRPARFMIYESYIVGGLGSYVLGDVLCGIIKTKEDVVLQPGDLKSDIGFIEKDRKLVEKGLPGERIAINLPKIKTSKIKRGMVISMERNKPSERAKDLKYGLGFFIGAGFKGRIISGMKFFLVSNHISRKCQIHVQCLLDLETSLISQKEGNSFKSGEIVFLKITAADPLIIEDPNDFPEFSLVELRDNCQTVAIGKIYKVVYKKYDEQGNEIKDDTPEEVNIMGGTLLKD